MPETSLPESWRATLDPVLATPRLRALDSFLAAEEAAGKTIYPPRKFRFAALDHTPLDTVKVVILGQDPYHGPGQAHGLAFSVPEGIAIPPSLRNIYKELETDLGIAPAAHGNLTRWGRPGRPPAQHRADGRGRAGRIAPAPRLGRLHRRRRCRRGGEE